tara:strand:- start:1520 stop:2536 length:1017 start_codon:yes stop_codon:yes gene_type:complete
MEYPAINIAKDTANQGLFFDVKPGIYDVWAIEFGYSAYQTQEQEKEFISKILSRSTEKELVFANDAFDMRSPGKGTDPSAMIYDLSSDPVEHSIDKIDMILKIAENLKENYTANNDTYEELYRSYRTLLFSYYQSLNIISRQVGGVKVDLSHTNQNSNKKPFESVDLKTQKKALNIIAEYGFSNKFLLQPDIIPFLQKQRRGFSISDDPRIHELVLRYQNRLLDHLLNSNVLKRITNSTLYGNDYNMSKYMIDLRKSIFKSDISSDASTIGQNLQISFVNRLLDIVNEKSNFDNFSKSSAYYNLDWLSKTINPISGNISLRQHNSYILYLINSYLDRE